MTTLIMGFVGLVIIPALILSTVFNRLIKDPVENPARDEHMAFKFLPEKIRSEDSGQFRKQL